MSTKTMHPPPRRVPRASTCSTNNNNNSKHKEMDHDGDSKPKICNDNNNKGSNLSLNNTLFAGYLAHEFLTKGTLLGQQMSSMSSSREEPLQQKYNRYVEVAYLLKSDGTHFPDIVNPTQLGLELRLP
ncbi:hypothetical protein MtrunA17_Chr7g0261571 [Medicago truncatula]|uniref:Uncharacterized protein n=1 Tax=Medicago truncatula TaxID=3880 RepID=I3S8W9_MEDTR|nr:unknown [Medicago truncatula]KEH23952.1 hypothetical protein MTR_7g097220 [Medicago truncatula]RHN48234.1 hypothetical protein MtrunA17_Chr7g0261571 [Medicago truncatula]